MRIVVLVFALALCHAALAQPVPVIFDTDLGPDCDDAGAMALLHALADAGEAEILGVVCSTKDPWCAPAADVINTYYGRPDVPVGTLKGPGFLGTSESWFGGAFNGYLAGHFPNDLQHGSYAEDAVTLYRRLLASADDSSVAVVVVGGMTNLRDLLVSDPDSISPLTGRELVLRRVRELSVMGGGYPSGHEANFLVDGPATRYMVEHWPTPVVFSGVEIGQDVLSGPDLWPLPEDNPVRMAYHLWDMNFAWQFTPDFDPETGIWPHSSFDQTAVLYAVRGLRDYWTTVSTGRNAVTDDGRNVWESEPDRDQAYLVRKMPDDELAKVIEELMIRASD
ncbi:MAG TPA: nucleoside hydrolase [Rhodothermales bacterium]